jgi:hypothetical protein
VVENTQVFYQGKVHVGGQHLTAPADLAAEWLWGGLVGRVTGK